MKKRMFKLFALLMLSAGALLGCNDDDDDSSILGIGKNDATYGFIMNSTAYRVAIDFEQENDFQTVLEPGKSVAYHLKAGRTHMIHAVVLNENSRALSESYYNFYIDEFALDNTLHDFVCSWYVELLYDSGFGNKSGD